MKGLSPFEGPLKVGTLVAEGFLSKLCLYLLFVFYDDDRNCFQ